MGKLTGAGMSPHQIYEYLTNGPGTGMLDEAQAATRILWAKEEERADLIRKQAELIRNGWQGAASDGAFGAAQPLAASALSGADQLSLAEDLLDRQSGSFHRAANSVRPVPPEPPRMDMLDTMAPFVDFEKEVKAYQADAQHNIEVFRGYDNASEYNQTNIPAQYSTISHSGGDISVTTDDARRGGTGDFIDVANYEPPRSGDDSGERGNPGGRPPGGTPNESPIGEPAGGSPVSGPPQGAQPPRQTSPSDFAPPSVNAPGLPLPSNQPTHTGPTPGGLVAGPPLSGFPGSGTGEPGARGGSAGRGAPGTGVRGGLPGAGVPSTGPGPGSGVGAIAAGEAAARRAAAAAAARGTGPGVMGGAPVAPGRGKDDEEHQRKILIEVDPESTFGSEILTAPQVIGDDDYEDD